VGVVESAGTASAVVGTYSGEGEASCIVSEAAVQGTPCIPATHTGGVVKTTTAVAVRMVAAAARVAVRIATSPTVRDWHRDLKVGLRTRCVATVAEAEEYKRGDERREASPVAMVGSSRSANSSTQTTPRWKAANAVAVAREVWCWLEGQWTAVAEPLPVLLVSRAPNVARKQRT